MSAARWASGAQARRSPPWSANPRPSEDLDLALDRVAARRSVTGRSSSAARRVGEDSADASFAGQLDSIGDVVTGWTLCAARVLASGRRSGRRGRCRTSCSRRVALAGMGVVVQRQIRVGSLGRAVHEGTRAAQADADRVLRRLGEALVSGRENPGRLLVTMDGRQRTIRGAARGQPRAESLLTDRTDLPAWPERGARSKQRSARRRTSSGRSTRTAALGSCRRADHRLRAGRGKPATS